MSITLNQRVAGALAFIDAMLTEFNAPAVLWSSGKDVGLYSVLLVFEIVLVLQTAFGTMFSQLVHEGIHDLTCLIHDLQRFAQFNPLILEGFEELLQIFVASGVRRTLKGLETVFHDVVQHYDLLI